MSFAAAATAPRRIPRAAVVIGALAALVGVLTFAELAFGPVALSLRQIAEVLAGQGDPAPTAILTQIRAPRAALALAVGAGLALSGCALQGVLRNPLADPGLIGVSAGGAVGAVGAIVLGGAVAETLPAALRPYLLPLAAFAGALATTALIFRLARREGRTSVAVLILAGVAVNAVAGAFLGAMAYVSTDAELRELTFWTMGGLGGADWASALVACVVTLCAGVGLWRLAPGLDLLQLGERGAFHAGLDVERVKLLAAALSALAVGAGVAAAGPIGFIGLVAPHLARLLAGPSHRVAAPAAALTGAALLLGADLISRTALPPAEPPVGLACSLIGGPFFLWLLLARLRRGGLDA